MCSWCHDIIQYQNQPQWVAQYLCACTCMCTCTCCLPLSRPRTKSCQTIEASTYSAISASQALNVTASVPLRVNITNSPRPTVGTWYPRLYGPILRRRLLVFTHWSLI
ncbi:hypothetical protein V8C40DRAFT_244902, partial [Trichoderma camerunense]